MEHNLLENRKSDLNYIEEDNRLRLRRIQQRPKLG